MTREEFNEVLAEITKLAADTDEEIRLTLRVATDAPVLLADMWRECPVLLAPHVMPDGNRGVVFEWESECRTRTAELWLVADREPYMYIRRDQVGEIIRSLTVKEIIQRLTDID